MNRKICMAIVVTFLSLSASQARADNETWKFTLMKGKGTEVCDAYLLRLQSMKRSEYPFCDRPEDDRVEGFVRLNRVSLTAEEAHRLIPLTSSFANYQNQDRWEISKKAGLALGLPPGDLVSLKTVVSYLNRWIFMWRYEPKVDIDNDGKPDSLLVARGVGAGGGVYGCGRINEHTGFPEGLPQLIFAVDFKQMRVEEARTKELFQHPSGGFPRMENGMKVGFLPGFRAVGDTMAVFKYRDIYYFDTFLDSELGDFEGRRANSRYMADTLAVFRRKDGVTKQVCEYRWHRQDTK